jgi:HSP20 family protein
MGTLQKYDPFRDIWNLGDEVGRLFWGLGHRPLDRELEAGLNFVPALDVAEDNEKMTITAELPGLKKEDVQIKVRDGVLTLSGEKKFEEETKKDNYYRIERSYGNFARSFTLPTTVDSGKIEATMKDGILKVAIPKKPEAKEREVKVQVQ